MPIYFPKVPRNTIRAVLAVTATLFALASSAAAQSEASIDGARGGVAAGGELDNYLRYLQSMGKVPVGAWGLRPFSAAEVDSLSNVSGSHPWQQNWMFRRDSAHRFSVLPLTANAGFNSAFPWGSNDGAVWAGRGLTTSVSGGVAAAWGPISLVLDPIVFRAENTSFTLQPNGQTGNGKFANGDFPSEVDLPQRFGNGPYSRFDWGQSTLRIAMPSVTTLTRKPCVPKYRRAISRIDIVVHDQQVRLPGGNRIRGGLRHRQARRMMDRIVALCLRKFPGGR